MEGIDRFHGVLLARHASCAKRAIHCGHPMAFLRADYKGRPRNMPYCVKSLSLAAAKNSWVGQAPGGTLGTRRLPCQNVFFTLTARAGLAPWLAGVVTVIASAGLGWLVEVVFYRLFYRRKAASGAVLAGLAWTCLPESA